MKLLPPAFLAWMPLAHTSAVEVRNRQHPSRKEDTSVPLCPKQFGFFKCLEVKPSGSHSSSNSAGPQENKAAGTWLCVMLPHHNSSIFLKTIKLSERTQITEVSGAPLAQPSCFDWRTRADSWEGNKQVSISVIDELLLADGIPGLLCSSSAWQRVRNPWQSSCSL